jgi:hypothetical protein
LIAPGRLVLDDSIDDRATQSFKCRDASIASSSVCLAAFMESSRALLASC